MLVRALAVALVLLAPSLACAADEWQAEWERELEDEAAPEAAQEPRRLFHEVPYGLKISDDSVHLEEDETEMQALTH